VPTEKRQRQKEGQRARREAALAAARRRQRKRQIITFAGLAVVIIGVLFLLSNHGGGKKKTNVSAKGTTTTTAAATTTPSTSKANAADKPKIDVPSTPAPTTLETKDLKVGTGKETKLGDTIEVNYVGVTYSDGKEFDSSWSRGATAAFKLEEGGLIEGWIKGIPGMKVGGRRQLIIPASLAYGDTPPSGAPKGALIFIVDLVSIQ